MELLRDDKSHLEVSFDSLHLYYHILHAGKPCQLLVDVSMGDWWWWWVALELWISGVFGCHPDNLPGTGKQPQV
jgi:hypothetical protein